jgi:HEAT repeat protein/energy-coupling factor transporter ATP-binding protein EcfA2
MSRNIRWDDFLLENVLSLVEALIELSEQPLDDSKPFLWVEWRENKLRVTGYKTQPKGKRNTTSEFGTKKENLLNQIKDAGKNLQLSSKIKESDEIQYVLDCLKELGVREDEESAKNQGYWKFSLKLKHQTATREENLEVVKQKWREHPETKSKKTLGESTTDNGIDWREVFHNKLENQLEFIRHKATERGFEINVHVPLGLVERKQQQRRDKASSPQNPYNLEQEVIVKTYEHDAFLQEVIGLQSTENKKHIGIIGEAGAGKTTLLSKVAEYLKNETEYLPVWISLASLQGETLENYLLDTWFSSIECSKTTEQLKQRFSQADIWLLLDGVDEMAENSPLDAFKIDKLPDWLRKARFVLTCRLNVWDERINNPLTGFETYKTQEFKPKQVDEFIQNWFQRAESIEKGRLLQTKLKESRHDKICSLVTNPLRLSLLCQTFYLDKQGELPETKAGLYERFTNYFYEWKPENIPQALRYSDDKKDELHKALSKLALAGIDSNGRFRLDRQFARKQMGEEIFKLACDVGWLNLVDRDAKTDRELYAFFHANFQEYFAALAIDDWDYFLPREHDNKPVADKRYRIFEPQWKEVILLWLGRDEDDVSDVEKEEFIKTLVEFDDGCWDENLPHLLKLENAGIVSKGFHRYPAYFLAAAGIAEFKECDLADKIIQQVVEWGFGKFNSETKKWEEFFSEINQPAKEVLQETNREYAIDALVELIRNSNHGYIKLFAAQSLGKVDPGNENAINALVDIIRNSNHDSTKLQAARRLGEIAVGNENAINVLVGLISDSNDDSTKLFAAQSLGEIAVGDENAINALVDLIRNSNDDSTKLFAAQSLGKIDPGNENAINVLVDLIRNSNDDSTKYSAAQSLGKTDPGNENAINVFVDLIRKSNDDSTKHFVAQNLGEIAVGNENTINALVDLIRNSNHDLTKNYVAQSLSKIAVGNENAINALVDLIRNLNHDLTKLQAARSLEKIDPGNENAINALVDLIRNSNHDWIKNYAAQSLEAICKNKDMPKVVATLTPYLSVETYNNNSSQFERCHGIIWKCAENMTYSEFYQAWHQQNN